MSHPRLATWLALLAVLATATGCIRFRYSSVNTHEPIDQAQIGELSEQLSAGHADLATCLDELGAPVLVWQTDPGFAIAYGWRDQGAWTFHVGYTWQFILRAHVDYSSASLNLEGLVLWFDDDERLVALSRGQLSDLVQSRRIAPADS